VRACTLCPFWLAIARHRPAIYDGLFGNVSGRAGGCSSGILVGVPSMSDGIKQPVVQELMAVIQSRKANPPPRSYTSSLFAGGVEKIGAKVLEEAREVVEAADVVYHLLVLLAQRETTWSEVEAVLAARFGISGLDEKESRKS
jgi:phosphoribosyl-ATP pyrophosphohydrolase